MEMGPRIGQRMPPLSINVSDSEQGGSPTFIPDKPKDRLDFAWPLANRIEMNANSHAAATVE